MMMEAIMDGATWQLRDLSAAAVSMTVHDGTLCCESADAAPVTLKQVAAGRE
jgi:hypothetical protein